MIKSHYRAKAQTDWQRHSLIESVKGQLVAVAQRAGSFSLVCGDGCKITGALPVFQTVRIMNT